MSKNISDNDTEKDLGTHEGMRKLHSFSWGGGEL